MNDFDLLPAGPEIDRLVAEKVMGWTGVHWYPGSGPCQSDEGSPAEWLGRKPGKGWDSHLPEYSADIACAWEVVEKIKGLEPTIWFESESWICEVQTRNDENHRGIGLTAPLAICHAALRAVLR